VQFEAITLFAVYLKKSCGHIDIDHNGKQGHNCFTGEVVYHKAKTDSLLCGVVWKA